MPATIPNLWPRDIKLEVLSPQYILKSQIRGIAEATNGVISSEVTSVVGGKEFITHRLDLIPVQLDGSRHRILSATHRESAFYPVVIEAEVYWPKPKTVTVTRNPMADLNPFLYREVQTVQDPIPDRWPNPDDWRPIATSQEEFVTRVGEVLTSKPVRALINSLLARTYEKALEQQDIQAENGAATET